MQATVDLVRSHDKNFSQDPRGGPWCTLIRTDNDFAAEYAALNLSEYTNTVAGMYRSLFDRDTAPGAEAEQLLALDIPSIIIPGADEAHATSAAMYLNECLSESEYVDIPASEQSEDNIPPRILGFLKSVIG